MKLGLNSYSLIIVLQEIFLYVPLRVRYCYRKGQQVQKVGQKRSLTLVTMKFCKKIFLRSMKYASTLVSRFDITKCTSIEKN